MNNYVMYVSFLSGCIVTAYVSHIIHRLLDDAEKNKLELRVKEEKEQEQILKDRKFLDDLRKTFVYDYTEANFLPGFYVSSINLQINKDSSLYKQIKEMQNERR